MTKDRMWIIYTSPMDGGDGDLSRPLFARVRMVGEEFEGGRIPVRSLDELARYQTLIVAAAAAEWRDANPDQSLPGDFESHLELVLAKVEDGSAVSLLERPHQTEYDDYFVRGRQVVEHDIELAGSENFDIEDLSLVGCPEFFEFGSSLRGDEFMQIDQPGSADEAASSFTVTSQTPRRIRDAVAPRIPTVERPERSTVTDWIVGRLTAINADKKNYTISLPDEDRSVNGKYRDDEILLDLKAVLDSSERAPVIRLQADLRFVGDQLDRILDVFRVQVLEIDGQPWSRRFIELANLGRGWHDDYPGSAVVSFSALDGARAVLAYVAERGRPQPGIFPTVEGGVSLEWASGAQVSTVEVTEEAEFQLFHIARGAAVAAVDRATMLLPEVFDFIDGLEL